MFILQRSLHLCAVISRNEEVLRILNEISAVIFEVLSHVYCYIRLICAVHVKWQAGD